MSGWTILALLAGGVGLVMFGYVLGWQHRGEVERLNERWQREQLDL